MSTNEVLDVPNTPELARNPVYVSRLDSIISVDMVGERVLTSDVEIGDAKDSVNRKKPINLINHGKVPFVNSNLAGGYDGIMESE